MYSNVVKLIKKSLGGTNKYGDPVYTEAEREVFAQIKSISQKEYYEANTSGFKPELKVVLADYYDYDGEDTIEYDGVRYDIYRTYRSNISIELTCQRSISKG